MANSVDTLAQLQELLKQAAPTVAPPLDPDAHLTINDFDKHTDRYYYVTIKGSLNDFARGTVQPVWMAKPGCEHIYQRIAGTENGKPQFEGDVSKAVILGLELESVTSDFPVDIGAVITGVNGKMFLDDGRNFAFIAEKKVRAEPKACIFEPTSKVTRDMLQQYNDTSSSKMESHCFRGDNGETLVDNQSPLARMLRLNQEILNMSFGLGPTDTGFLRVATPIIDACLARYDEEQKVNFVDKNNFRIDFERVDNPIWNAPEGVIDNLRSNQRGGTGHVASQRLSNIYTLTAVLREKLVLYGNQKA